MCTELLLLSGRFTYCTYAIVIQKNRGDIFYINAMCSAWRIYEVRETSFFLFHPFFFKAPYFLLSTCVEKVEQSDDVAVVQPAHDLQLPVLKSLVLQHLLDGHHLPSLTELGLVHYTKTTISNNLHVSQLIFAMMNMFSMLTLVSVYDTSVDLSGPCPGLDLIAPNYSFHCKCARPPPTSRSNLVKLIR